MPTTDLNKSTRMHALIAECEASGLSVKQFCKEHGIATGTYYYWHKKYHAPCVGDTAARGGFELLDIPARDISLNGLYAEYKGIRFYQEPSASLLKSLII